MLLQDEDLGAVVSELVLLLDDNNAKISHGSLKCVDELLLSFGERMSPFYSSLSAGVLERLGDARQPVRELARKICEGAVELGVQSANEAMQSFLPALESKNWRVKEQVRGACPPLHVSP